MLERARNLMANSGNVTNLSRCRAAWAKNAKNGRSTTVYRPTHDNYWTAVRASIRAQGSSRLQQQDGTGPAPPVDVCKLLCSLPVCLSVCLSVCLLGCMSRIAGVSPPADEIMLCRRRLLHWHRKTGKGGAVRQIAGSININTTQYATSTVSEVCSSARLCFFFFFLRN